MMRGIKQHQKEEQKNLTSVEKALSKEKSGKTKRVSKIPGAPKRPTTAFFRWAATAREAIKEELGSEAKPTDIMRRAGEKWKTVDDKIRAKYQAQYEAEKAEFDATMAKLKKAAGSADSKPAASKAVTSKPAAAASSDSPSTPTGGVKRAHSSSIASDADSVTDVDTSVVHDSAKKHKKKSKKSKSSKKHKKHKKSHGEDSE